MKYIVMDFKKNRTVFQRIQESSRILAKYPDRCPIICYTEDKSLPLLDKHKYLVPMDLTMGQFSYVIRKRIKLNPEKAIYMFVNNQYLMPSSAIIQELYEKNKDEDGFLYISFSSENTFG